jgi:pimeloyl-ACP methyl ester carboxylesterase
MHATEFVGLNGLTLAADVGGDPGNPPAILMHGGGQTRHSWGETAAALADNGFYVVSLDMRGHGDSAWSPDGDYSIDPFVGDLRAVCATIGRPAALIGASLGGITALLAVGETEAPMASAVILVDVAPKVNREGVEEIFRFMHSSAPKGFASLADAADAVAAYLPHRPRPTETSGLMKNLRLRDDGRYYWHWDPRIVEIAPESLRNQYERMATAARNIKVPSLLVRGGNSELLDDESVADFLELVPTAEYAVIKGAHHMVAGDSNTAFSSAVVEFMARRVHHGRAGHFD